MGRFGGSWGEWGESPQHFTNSSIGIHSSCNAENEEDVMCEPYNLFIPDIHLAIDLETTTNALIPRIIRQIGMPDVTGDLFSLYVYWEGKKPRPLGPEEVRGKRAGELSLLLIRGGAGEKTSILHSYFCSLFCRA